MIEICFGKDVTNLLERVRHSAWQFASITLCSPFIGESEAVFVATLMLNAGKQNCGVRVITSPSAAARLMRLLPANAIGARHRIVVRRGLHAKFYLAQARRARNSEVIVTSANLTRAGLTGNDELGVRGVNDCDDGVRLVNGVSRYAQQLAA